MNLIILYATCMALFCPAGGTKGTQELLQGTAQEDSLHIGLLVPDQHSGSVIQAAQMAIDEANQPGNSGEQPFKLIVRSSEGFWGAGSKESVSLVFEDQVRAIVGSLDGRNAHLAEQVAAKSHLVYLETRTTDPTLSQAYVPWFFRIVPNDNQQARAILERIMSLGGERVAILSRDQYDTRYAVKSLVKSAALEIGLPPLILYPDSAELAYTDLLVHLKKSRAGHLVIPYVSDSVIALMGLIRKEIPQIRMYGTLAFSAGLKASDMAREELQGMHLIHSYASERRTDLATDLTTDLYAMYAYEGVKLILNGIKEAGSDRNAIREYLLRVAHADGISGTLSFDSMGNRKGILRLVKIEEGQLLAPGQGR